MADVPQGLVLPTNIAMSGSQITFTLNDKTREWSIQADGATISVGFSTGAVSRKIPDTQSMGMVNPNFKGCNLYLTGTNGSVARVIEILGNAG